MRTSKRDVVAFCGKYTGLTSLLALLPKKPLLLVLNYHRIGDFKETPYDPGVFSATADELEDQVRFVKRRFHIVALDEALEMLEAREFRRAAVLLTFDDGYKDNHDVAFPILSAYGVPGVFFLPTSFIGTNRVAIWDSVAYVIRGSRRPRFRLACAPLREFDIAADGLRTVAGQVMSLYKNGVEADAERFLTMVEEACDSARPNHPERLFMNWEEAAAMARGGMAIGSHTHTHPVLSQAGRDDLIRELTISKTIIETRLKHPAQALAYPFGLPETISPAVFQAAEETQYRAAFSFHGGVNPSGAIERFNVHRQAVCPEEARIFSLRATLAAVTGAATVV